MQPDGLKVLEFHEFVKLKLYDSSGAYIAKTVCVVISHTLCAPVLLGLCFLKHNNIIIDVEAQTTIDKLNNFDLHHTSAPPAKMNDVKPKLQFNYEAHKTILDHCAALLTEMKSTFAAK